MQTLAIRLLHDTDTARDIVHDVFELLLSAAMSGFLLREFAAQPSGYRVIALALRLRRIEPDVSTERVRSNEFRGCFRGLSLTHCLGDTSGAFLWR